MSTIKTTTLSNVAGTSSVPVDTVINGSAKAWVNFNGTGTVAIRAAFNVSSITDNGSGDFTVNFTTALQDANYSMAGTASFADGVNDNNILLIAPRRGSGLGAFTPSSARVNTAFRAVGSTTQFDDGALNCLSFFR